MAAKGVFALPLPAIPIHANLTVCLSSRQFLEADLSIRAPHAIMRRF